MTESRIQQLEVCQAVTQDAILTIKDTLNAIKDSLDTLADLETHHAYTRESLTRAFKDLKALDERVKKIEIEIPRLVETRGWIVMGLLGTMGLVGMTVFYVAIKIPG